MASSVMVSSAAVLRAAPAQARMVTPFTGIKSTSPFPVTRMANADLSKLPSNGGRVHCMQEPISISSLQPASQERRSANYHPTIWKHHVIESICSPYSDTVFRSRIEELKLEPRQLLMELNTPLLKLEFINSLQRLGVAYHLQEEIRVTLDQIYINGFEPFHSLYGTALCFRLLRQHGYNVSSDVFDRFRDGGGFKNCYRHDKKGLLSLYEAAHLGMYGERALEEAKEFSIKHLKSPGKEVDLNFIDQVKNSLEVPLHWRLPRLEARNYIDVYEREDGRSSVLLEMAKLDFNVVQSMHQNEVKEISRWWKELRLGDQLRFSRDRVCENYAWAAGIAFEPRFSKLRKVLTKLICILTVIDDIYDVYGSLEELQLFTSAIKSWDSRNLESLPDYLKICFNALYNFVNETAYDIFEDYGWDAMLFIRREWENLCETYLKEAEWFDKGYTPTLSEYLENAWISVGGPIVMVHTYFLIGHNSPERLFNSFGHGHGVIYWSSLITRLSDDLGTSEAEMKRGDTPKSVQCHMNGTGESDDTAKEYIKDLIISSWMNLNKDRLSTNLPADFVNMILNMARTAQWIFQHGDGVGNSTIHGKSCSATPSSSSPMLEENSRRSANYHPTIWEHHSIESINDARCYLRFFMQYSCNVPLFLRNVWRPTQNP